MRKKFKEFEWGILLFAWSMYAVISALFVRAYRAAAR